MINPNIIPKFIKSRENSKEILMKISTLQKDERNLIAKIAELDLLHHNSINKKEYIYALNNIKKKKKKIRNKINK